MGLLFSFFAVITLGVIVFAGVKAVHLHYLFGVIIPYAAFLTFIIGIIYRVVQWGRVPVPFRIPTTAGQEKLFPGSNTIKLITPLPHSASSSGWRLKCFFSVPSSETLKQNYETVRSFPMVRPNGSG